MESQKTVDDFVKELNENQGLLKNLNVHLRKTFNSLPDGSFSDLDAFVSFLPNTIKNFFDKKNLEKLGEEWKNFEIQDKDLEALYEINLAQETKTAIIKKFDMSNKGSVKVQKGEHDKKAKAFSILKKILGKDKISVSSFCAFICNNFSSGALSDADLGDIVDHVQLTGEEDKFRNWEFWNVCDTFEGISSKKFINFMVENTDFTKLYDDQLICSIIVLVEKHPKYQKDKNKDNMVEALQDILCGNDPYKKFSEALANVPSIETKIKLDNIEEITDEDVAAFAKELRDNSI